MHNNISCVVVVVVFFTFVDMMIGSDIGRICSLSNVSIPFLSSVCFVLVPVQTAKIPVCLIFRKSHMCILHSEVHMSSIRA